MELDRKILNRIEKENISIKPRWFFTVRDFSFGLIDILLLVGFFIAGMMMLYYYKTIGKEAFLSFSFYLWLGLLVALLFIVLQITNRIANLFKLRLIMVLPILLLANSAFGFYSNETGLADKVEEKLEKTIPAYEKIIPKDFEVIRNKNKKSESDKANKENNAPAKPIQSENKPDKEQNKDMKNDGLNGKSNKANRGNDKAMPKIPEVPNSGQQGNGNARRTLGATS